MIIRSGGDITITAIMIIIAMAIAITYKALRDLSREVSHGGTKKEILEKIGV